MASLAFLTEINVYTLNEIGTTRTHKNMKNEIKENKKSMISVLSDP